MTIRKNIILTALLCSTAFTASADDYYAQFNVGYAQSLKPGKDFTGKKVGKSIVLGGEVGENLNRHFRAGLSFDYRPSFSYNGNISAAPVNSTVVTNQTGPTNVNTVVTNISSQQVNTKISSLSAMLNLYYDIGEFRNFMPYLMVGVGASRNATKKTTLTAIGTDTETNTNPASTIVTTNPSATISGKKKDNFAFKVGVGTRLYINESFDADIRYQYVDLGKFSTGTTASGTSSSGKIQAYEGHLRSNEVSIGAVYKF